MTALTPQQAAAELSWATITAAQLRAKIADIEAIPMKAIRETYARMLAHAITNHAPHHLALIPPEWLKPELPRP